MLIISSYNLKRQVNIDLKVSFLKNMLVKLFILFDLDFNNFFGNKFQRLFRLRSTTSETTTTGNNNHYEFSSTILPHKVEAC